MLFSLILTLALLAIPVVTLRLLAIVRSRAPLLRTPGTPTRILVVLGSGGHTAEILSALRMLDTSKYSHRSYIISSGDAFSALKAKEFERGLKDNARSYDKSKSNDHSSYGSFDIATVPRARQIHQSIFTTPLSSFWCLLACLEVLMRPNFDSSEPSRQLQLTYPDLILSNGPATAVIVVMASLVLRFLGMPGTHGRMRTIYIESWARVRKLSLSGKILVKIVDRFLVQWEGLLGSTNGKGEYIGVLV